MKTIFVILMTIIVIVAFGIIFNYAIEKAEFVECQRWESDFKNIEDFYAVPWQVAQCLHYGIDLSRH